MRTSVFILVVLVLGFLLTTYFDRRRQNYEKRHPGQKNPIVAWFTGKDEEDDGKKK